LKTNMTFLHKNRGPIWKRDFFRFLHVDVPFDFETNILEEQREWEKRKAKRSTAEFLKLKAEHRQALASRRNDEAAFSQLQVDIGGKLKHEYKPDEEPEEESEQVLELEMEKKEMSSDLRIDLTKEGQVIVSFDLETTGLDRYHDHIIQISACIHGTDFTFDRFVRTNRTFSPEAARMHQAIIPQLKSEKYFDEVSKDFFDWIEQNARGKEVILIAHNGFHFDFPVLYFELRRNGTLDLIQKLNIFAADSLDFLKKIREEKITIQGLPLENKSGKMKLEAIYSGLFPEGKEIKFHNSLEDCQALSKILFESELNKKLDRMVVVRLDRVFAEAKMSEVIFEKRLVILNPV